MTRQEEREWEKVQEKTFTKWVNERLAKGGYGGIESVLVDVSDGVVLAHLLMVLQDEVVEYNPKPYTRIQKMENMERVLGFIKRKRVKLINIGPGDIVDGNHKLILGLVWSLISRLGITEMADSSEVSVRKELLRWCRDVTSGYENVNVVDFSRSWQDGLAFNAIIHRFRPDLVPGMHGLKGSERTRNLEQAFRVAEDFLDIKRLLDVEDITEVSVPDEKSIMTYVSSYYQKFKEYEKERSAFNKVRNMLEVVEWSVQSRNLYEIKARGLATLIKELGNRRKEACELIRSLDKVLCSLWETNGRAMSEASEVHTLLGSINAVHEFCKMKKYTPPEDLHIDKLRFVPLHPQSVTQNVELGRLFDGVFQSEVGTINRIFELVQQISCPGRKMEEQMENTSELRDKLVGMKFSNGMSKSQHEDFMNIVEKKIDTLRRIQNKEMGEERVVEEASVLFNNVCKDGEGGISPADLCRCLSHLGLWMDEGMISFASTDGRISLDDYLLIVKETHKSSFDPVELRRAFRTLSTDGDALDLRTLNIRDRDLKNIYYLNKGSPSLKIDDFFENFIEN